MTGVQTCALPIYLDLVKLIAQSLKDVETLTKEDIYELVETGKLAWWEKKKVRMEAEKIEAEAKALKEETEALKKAAEPVVVETEVKIEKVTEKAEKKESENE